MTKAETLILAPTNVPGVFLSPDGRKLSVPAGWECLPPGDAGLTRRVKQLGPSWTVQEKRGRKVFSQGVYAQADHIAQAKEEVARERSTESYARRRQSDLARREDKQASYVTEFAQAVRAYLHFAPAYAQQQSLLVDLVTAHATPVGSQTVARTQRIPVEERAASAVIAWLRHKTTAYDSMSIPRQKGMRREVRRDLAAVSRSLLDAHRRGDVHAPPSCPLCTALAQAQPVNSASLSSESTL